MAYTRTTWQNYPGNTPVNATRLNNMEQGLVDAHNFSVICTSSTRPASPFAGQQIYETDTGYARVYDGSLWRQAGPIPSVSSLPSSPVDGDQIVYTADGAQGVRWHLKYRSASASAYKWEFIGGGGVTTTTTAYPASSYPSSFTSLTSGPAWMPPLAGDYNVRHWGRLDIYAPIAERIVEICPATNTVAASSSYATAVGNWVTSGAVYRSAWTGERLMQGMLSTEYLTIKAQYQVGLVYFVPFYCGMTATPIRVG